MRAEDPDEAGRAEAAVTALRLGDEEALAQVRDLTRGADPASPVARRGAIALGERGDPAAVPLLIALAADPEAEEPRRADAIELLGELGSPRALPVLTALLSDLRLRILAADALGRIGDRRAGRPLAQALEREPYIPARVAEAEALVRLADRRAEPLIRRFLGTPTPLPGGVRMLRDLRALRETTGRGAELQRSPRALEGSWECDDAGCRPGEGAAILLPVARAPREEARAVVLTVALSDGAALVLDGERRVLRAGAQELAFDAQPSTERRRFDVVIEGDVRIVAIVVVPPEEDLLVQE
jgi:HEAT repeat protein